MSLSLTLINDHTKDSFTAKRGTLYLSVGAWSQWDGETEYSLAMTDRSECFDIAAIFEDVVEAQIIRDFFHDRKTKLVRRRGVTQRNNERNTK